jgi:small subunit ribosomal protein S25e
MHLHVYLRMRQYFIRVIMSFYCPVCFPSVFRKDPPLTFSTHAVKDKSNHAVVLDKTISEKLYKDVQSYRLITVATLVDRLKVNGSLARKALADLEEKGQIKKVVGHSKMNIYSTLSCFGSGSSDFVCCSRHNHWCQF